MEQESIGGGAAKWPAMAAFRNVGRNPLRVARYSAEGFRLMVNMQAPVRRRDMEDVIRCWLESYLRIVPL